MARIQEFRQLAVGTPLGDDVLLLRKMTGREGLGRLFDYELDLLSESPDIALADLVGLNVTVRVQMSPEGQPRYFNGYVSRFSLGRALDGLTEYRATIVPLECSPESDPGVMRVSSRLLAERNSHETEASQSTAGGSEVAGGAGGIGGWA